MQGSQLAAYGVGTHVAKLEFMPRAIIPYHYWEGEEEARLAGGEGRCVHQHYYDEDHAEGSSPEGATTSS